MFLISYAFNSRVYKRSFKFWSFEVVSFNLKFVVWGRSEAIFDSRSRMRLFYSQYFCLNDLFAGTVITNNWGHYNIEMVIFLWLLQNSYMHSLPLRLKVTFQCKQLFWKWNWEGLSLAIFVDKFAKSFDNTNVSFSIWIKNKNEIDYDSTIEFLYAKKSKNI